MSEINYDYIVEYIRAIRPPNQGILQDIEMQIARGSATWPIIKPEVASFLEVMLAIKRPTKILEIGTAVGYSAILMSQYLEPGGQITTIERFDVMQRKAEEHINQANLNDKIKILQGNASELLPTLEASQYDVIFMDCAKGQYITFLPECIRLLKDDGILITDNVLHKGVVAKSRYLVPRRQRTTHGRLREFLYQINHHPQLKSAVLPFGDGIAISHKVGGINNEK
ncbi:MAG TPA: O-methyltransferase [Epulopiscium sp.]|nr:O-methyltransferase [Candidatus Epulonipiscium sp.]